MRTEKCKAQRSRPEEDVSPAERVHKSGRRTLSANDLLFYILIAVATAVLCAIFWSVLSTL